MIMEERKFTRKFDDFLAEQLQDEEFKKEYDDLQPLLSPITHLQKDFLKIHSLFSQGVFNSNGSSR